MPSKPHTRGRLPSRILAEGLPFMPAGTRSRRPHCDLWNELLEDQSEVVNAFLDCLAISRIELLHSAGADAFGPDVRSKTPVYDDWILENVSDYWMTFQP